MNAARAGWSWSLVEAGALPGAGNMALDLGLLAGSIAQERRDPAVRIYGWNPPALSVGANVNLPREVRE
ncbi:MAG TPA: hypothetical protein VGA71_07125, partial [Actinomycetota bacterium]